MSLLPIQTQAFLLYGNGAVIGDTTLVLSSFKDIDGNNLSMQGTVMTGTVEPNSGSSEEQIIFTGVTQNSNGTATLTGVSSVTFASPYTQTSGFKKSHAGNTTFVLSDTAYLYSQYAGLGNTQTFTGTDTFNISPFIPTVASTATTQAASVGYVNAIAIAGSPKASNTVIGITELSVAPVLASVPIAVGDNDTRVPTASEALALVGNGGVASNLNTYVTQLGSQIGTESYALTGGSSTAYTITQSPTPAGYVTGELIKFKVHAASGTTPTINKNSLGAKSLYKMTSTGTTALAVGDLGTNQMAIAEYDGGAYQVLNPTANTPTASPTYKLGTTTHDISATGTQTIAHGLGKIPSFIEIFAELLNSTTLIYSHGGYNGTTTATNYNSNQINASGTTSTYVIFLNTSPGSTDAEATATFDATNITLTWTKTSTPTGTAQLYWKAIG